MPRKSSAITLRTILSHIQGLRSALEERMDRLERRVNSLEQKMDRRFDILFMQIGNIDERLDIIEVKELPRIKAKLRMR